MVLAIIGWLALVALFGYLTIGAAVAAWGSAALTGRWPNPALMILVAAVLAAGWWGIAAVAPFHVSIS